MLLSTTNKDALTQRIRLRPPQQPPKNPVFEKLTLTTFLGQHSHGAWLRGFRHQFATFGTKFVFFKSVNG